MSMKKRVITAIALTVGALHFVTGEQYQGPLPAFVNGYLIDILLPFSAYFLLLLCEEIVPPLRSWIVRCVTTFAVICSAEVAQYFGHPIFGRTYDPWDFAAYAAGTLLAAFADRMILPRVLANWE